MFEEDEELAEDEEEILVYVEFDGSVAGNTFSNEKLQLDMIGLDKEHPIMQVNGKFYEGTYQDAVGTYMFFENDENPQVDDPVFDVEPNIKYCGKTRKVLKMNRIFVEPKTEMLGDSNEADFVPNMETIRKAGIPLKYQAEAFQSWETMRNDRMDALNTYLEKQKLRDEKRAQGIEPDSESDDDNPFAMYKPGGGEKKSKRSIEDSNIFEEKEYSMDEEDNEITRDNEGNDQDSQTLTVIDPGPSTSKDSQPWSSPSAAEELDSDSDSDDTYRINLPNVASKHKATVKVAKKGKFLKKTPNKKPLNKKGKQTRKPKDFDWEEPNVIDEMEAAELLSKDLEALLEVSDKDAKTMDKDATDLLESSNDNVSEHPNELEVIIDKRKLEKQQKRDEKMKLMSEKFRKAAEQSKLKSQQSSESGG